jgi:hypothetical protein
MIPSIWTSAVFHKIQQLLVFNSLLQILIFSDPYDFLASLFGAPCPEKQQKNLFAALLLEPRFLNFGASWFFYLAASLLGALDSLGPRAVWILRWNRKQKNRFGPGYLGPRFLNFGARRFLGTLSSLGPGAETLKQGTKKTIWVQLDGASLFKFWGPRVFWGTWAL